MFLNFITIVCLELNFFLFAVAANYLNPPYLKFFLESLNVLSSSKDFRSCFLLLNFLCFSLQRKDFIFMTRSTATRNDMESGYHQMVRVLLKQLTRVSQAGIFCFKIFRVHRPPGEVLLEKLGGGMRPAS